DGDWEMLSPPIFPDHPETASRRPGAKPAFPHRFLSVLVPDVYRAAASDIEVSLAMYSQDAAGGTHFADKEWEFDIGRFRYMTKWYNLSGQKLKLLKAFVQAHNRTLTHAEVDRAADNEEGYRHHAYVSELNLALQNLFRLKKKQHLVRPVPGEKAYRLT